MQKPSKCYCLAGIKSSVVYSLGAIDDIGVYNGEKIYSLLGESDYAVLRVTLDDRDYYCDIAWDAVVLENGHYDKLRLFLFSKNELKIRHKFVGEANITNTHSYRGDDSDDLIMFSNDRIKEVEETFDDIERLKPNIDGLGLNIAISKSRIREIKSELDNLDIDSSVYKDRVLELDNLEDKIDLDEAELIRLENARKGIISNYSKILINRYLNIYDGNNDMEVITVMNKKEEIKLISTYMSKLLKICKNAFYKVMSKLSDVELEEASSDFRMFRNNVKNALLSICERNRFTKGIFAWIGFNTKYLPYDVEPRGSGKTSFGWKNYLAYAMDGLLAFSYKPLQIATHIGIFTIISSLVYLITLLLLFFVVDLKIKATYIIIFLLLLLFGILFVLIGIVGKYIALINNETKGRPHYIIKTKFGFSDKTLL